MEARGRDIECPCCGPERPIKPADSCKRVCLCEHDTPEQAPRNGTNGWSLPELDTVLERPATHTTRGLDVTDGGVNRRPADVIPPLRV